MSTDITKSEGRLPVLLDNEKIKSRFQAVLGSKANAFMSSIVSATKANSSLEKCEPMSVISAAMTAATLDLPITPGLGMAHIVPYGTTATFQMGWKGYVQLALRSGQYKTINLTPIYEGQLVEHNQFTGDFEFQKEKTSDKVIGYLLYFRLINGYEKYFYMSREDAMAHGKRYSKSFNKKDGQWQKDPDAMGLKTVAKMGLSKYGVLSVDMQKAVEIDDGVEIEGEVVHPDGTGGQETPPADTGAKKPRKTRAEQAVESENPAPQDADETVIEGEVEPTEEDESAEDII